MNAQQVKLVIGGRIYPVKATSQQEIVYKRAAEIINKEILILESKHHTKNKQDSLAMLALQLMIQKRRMASAEISKKIDNKKENNQEINLVVDALISKIDSQLKVN